MAGQDREDQDHELAAEILGEIYQKHVASRGTIGWIALVVPGCILPVLFFFFGLSAYACGSLEGSSVSHTTRGSSVTGGASAFAGCGIWWGSAVVLAVLTYVVVWLLDRRQLGGVVRRATDERPCDRAVLLEVALHGSFEGSDSVVFRKSLAGVLGGSGQQLEELEKRLLAK